MKPIKRSQSALIGHLTCNIVWSLVGGFIWNIVGGIVWSIVGCVFFITACSNHQTVPASNSQNSASSNPQKEASDPNLTHQVSYTCPMHPQIQEDHPGNCPICGMTLVQKSGVASAGSGISLNMVLQPVNSSIISSVDFIIPQKKDVETVIIADGYLDFDARTFNNISARYSGRIEKLYIKYAFQEIHKGQHIFDIYSPEMVSAQQDLIYLNTHASQDKNLFDAARQKLLLMGMTSKQIDQVLKTSKPYYTLPVFSPYDGHVHDMPHSQMTGSVAQAAGQDEKPVSDFSDNIPLTVREGIYIEKGQNIFNVVDPHHLWAVLKIDPSATSSLKLNQAVKIKLIDNPEKTLSGKVNFIEPEIEHGDKSTSVRVYINNMDHELKVNSLVKATIKTGIKSSIWIPRSSVLDLGSKQVVWIKNKNLFKAHQVFTGSIVNNEIEIKKGLSLTDTLAENAGYLTDSENFIKINGDRKSDEK